MGVFFTTLSAIAAASIPLRFYYWLDRRRKDPVYLLGGSWAWGCVAGALTLLILAVFMPWHVAGRIESIALRSPWWYLLAGTVISESAKAVALVALWWMARRSFQRPLDGIVLAGTLAAGFAATENVFYLQLSLAEGGAVEALRVFAFRCLAGVFGQPLGTLVIGVSLVSAGGKPRRRQIRSLALAWAAAIVIRLVRNLLVLQTARSGNHDPLAGAALVDLSAWVFMGGLATYVVYREHRQIVKCLPREIEAGTLSRTSFRMLSSPVRYAGYRIQTLIPFVKPRNHRFLELFAELADIPDDEGDNRKDRTQEDDGSGAVRASHDSFENRPAIERIRRELAAEGQRF
ncbi:PrsW family intramembrane metalloprotease [Thermostilla marina]